MCELVCAGLLPELWQQAAARGPPMVGPHDHAAHQTGRRICGWLLLLAGLAALAAAGVWHDARSALASLLHPGEPMHTSPSKGTAGP
jgi:hypothetical protein